MIREFSAGGVVVRRMRRAAVRGRGPRAGRACSRCRRATSTATSRRPRPPQREVREETGVEAELGREARRRPVLVRARRRRGSCKIVAFFLFRYRSGSVEDHDHEVEEARWIPLEEAPRAARLQGRAGDGRCRAVTGGARPLGCRASCSSSTSTRRSSSTSSSAAARPPRSGSGDKSKKYRKGEVVLITVGFQHSPREKIFEAVIDASR